MKQDNFVTKTSMIKNELQEAIINGAFKPGERLIRRTLMKRHDSSLSIVNEALGRLENIGLVETKEMHGSRVVLPSNERLVNDLVLREAIECHVVYLLTTNIGDDTLKGLLQSATRLDEILTSSNQSDNKVRLQHLNFHLDMARATGHSILVDSLWKVGIRCIVLFNSEYNRSDSINSINSHENLILIIMKRVKEDSFLKIQDHMHYGLESNWLNSIKNNLDNI